MQLNIIACAGSSILDLLRFKTITIWSLFLTQTTWHYGDRKDGNAALFASTASSCRIVGRMPDLIAMILPELTSDWSIIVLDSSSHAHLASLSVSRPVTLSCGRESCSCAKVWVSYHQADEERF